MSTLETDQNWHWQAIDSERNIARDYRLSVSRDLFGWYVVEQAWGRIGTEGQGKALAFADATDAHRRIAAVKARRMSAKRRLGVGYLPTPTGAGKVHRLTAD
ncbi:MAG: WGR domain-containing protein [Alteraurantiacibacter sp. bin_em_oilr2.035]|nr:WGR domain-containing protein [Alteraurantiacibacter sp. bin_em_oilr2.035]